jgi:PadR family transcriptional regulator PadR
MCLGCRSAVSDRSACSVHSVSVRSVHRHGTLAPLILPALGATPLRPVHLFYNLGLMTTSLGTLELSALLAVSRLGDEAYGLAVRQDLSDRTGRDHSVGAIYTTLQRLEDKGLLASRASEPLPVRGGRSRRHFRLTGAGARAIRDAQSQARSMWAGVGTPIRTRST